MQVDDQRLIATGSDDGSVAVTRVCLDDMSMQQVARNSDAHQSTVVGVAFTSRTSLVSVGRDQ